GRTAMVEPLELWDMVALLGRIVDFYFFVGIGEFPALEDNTGKRDFRGDVGCREGLRGLNDEVVRVSCAGKQRRAVVRTADDPFCRLADHLAIFTEEESSGSSGFDLFGEF